jgi:co-chaperonin GroES (HSP10)
MTTPPNAKPIATGIIVKRLRGPKKEPSAAAGPEALANMFQKHGDVFIPETDQYKHKDFAIGEVVAVGNGVSEVKVGDKILYRTHLALTLPHEVTEEPTFYKVEETSAVIAAILP